MFKDERNPKHFCNEKDKSGGAKRDLGKKEWDITQTIF